MYTWPMSLITLFCMGVLAAPPYLGEPPVPYRGELKKRAVDHASAIEYEGNPSNHAHDGFLQQRHLRI
jgi:hypothetical protein